ncbi:hypothetical protein N9308_02970 [Candidatus Pelagibacter sp.]|nr:hypothetical protein [Candidatus Pelagibacter sp.]
MLTAIRQWVIKTMTKGNTGVVQTLPKQEIIEMNVQITAERIMRNGINPEDLKTVGQVENVVNQIETPKVNVNPGMTSVKKADVLDMEGNKIDTSKGIMAGKEINQKNLNEELMKTDNPYSELVNTPRPKTLAEREAEVLAGMEKNNKEMVQRIRDRKNKPLDPDDVLPDYNETPGAFTRRNTPGSKENLLQELKIAYEKDFNRLRGDETVEELKDILKNLDTDGVPFADGGRIGLLAGSVPKVLKFLKSKKKIDEAVNNIFPTGDYKYDAQMAADSLVENNPKIFGGKLYEDLDMDTQMEVYGAVIGPIQSNALAVSRMKKATRPEKTLASMKEGKGINMSDPDIADEFARFMKETDPKGTKELEQKLQLENFKTKDRSENADGGRIGLKTGMGKAFLEFLKKFKVKQSGDGVKEFLSKRKFMKDAVGNTEKNRKARELDDIKKSTEEYMKQYKGYQFPSDEQIKIDLEKRIQPILNKGRKLNADGGRIGLKAGMTKRAFLKLMGSFGLGVGAAKSGIFTGLGKGAGKTVAKEVAQQTTSGMPPPYFFKLAEKIKNMGSDVTSTTERTVSKSLKSKDGNAEYILEQDMVSGDTLIKKVNKEGDDMITDVQIMEYRMGENVKTRDGRVVTSPNEYEEVTEVNKRIYKDDYNASDYTDGIEEIELKKIIDEVDDQAPPIKYASGGLAYMLGE